MSMMDRTNSKVDLEIRNSSSNQMGDPRTVSIGVRDSASSQLIVEVPLSADMLLAALAGTYHGRIPAWVVPDEYRGRIGRKLETETIVVERPKYRDEDEALDRVAKPLGRPSHLGWSEIADSDEIVLRTFVQNHVKDWAEWGFQRHNYGWALHLRRWVDVKDSDSDA